MYINYYKYGDNSLGLEPLTYSTLPKQEDFIVDTTHKLFFMDITNELKHGKRRAIARAISIIENDDKAARALVKKIFKDSGKSITIGMTGPAGAGKSSLIDKISLELKKRGYKPSILSI